MLLLDLVMREETLKNVIRSVTRNGVSIILTAVFALILIYLFSIVGFLYLREVCGSVCGWEPREIPPPPPPPCRLSPSSPGM